MGVFCGTMNRNLRPGNYLCSFISIAALYRLFARESPIADGYGADANAVFPLAAAFLLASAHRFS
jgi:hypothetical protein